MVKIRFYRRLRIEDGIPEIPQPRYLPNKAGPGGASKRKQVRGPLFHDGYIYDDEC